MDGQRLHRGLVMRVLPATVLALTATVMCGAPAFSHHSMAFFDQTQEILIEGTVARFDWVNPHMYLYIETESPDGETVVIQGEGLGITQALVDGLDRDALQSGMPIVVRANPNRGGFGKQIRVLDVTTEDGEIHPFYAANTRTRRLTSANSLEGKWAPSRAALGAAFGALARFPLTSEGRAAQEEMLTDGLCYAEPTPVLSIFDEMRSIELGEDEVVLHFDNTGDHVIRTVRMGAEHPADLQPSRHGHSVGRWDGDTLIIDTVGFEPNPSGLGLSAPSSAGKHTIERLTLTEDRTRLRYEVTVEDPMYLTEPATLTQQWDHRPDLEFSPDSLACDDEVAERYIEE
jgi:hypothetical protein